MLPMIYLDCEMATERLGAGPWKLVDVVGPEDSHIGESPFVNVAADADHDKCACCGAKLTWRAVIENDKGVGHIVGMTCASRAGGDVLDLKDKHEKAEDNMIAARLCDPEFKAWAEKKPHPKGWAGGLYRDLKYLAGGSYDGRAKKRKLKPLNEAWEDYVLETTGKAPKKRKVGKRELARLALFDEWPGVVANLEARAEELGRAMAEDRCRTLDDSLECEKALGRHYDFDKWSLVQVDAEHAENKLEKAAKGLRGNPPFKVSFRRSYGGASDELEGKLALAFARGRAPDCDMESMARKEAEAAVADENYSGGDGEVTDAAAKHGINRNIAYPVWRAAYMKARGG